MVVHDYNCKCGARSEVDHPIEVDLKTVEVKCLTCGEVMERQFPLSGNFSLKGRNWARDGYGR